VAKDKFSDQASYYAAYRPGYPEELIEYVVGFVKNKDLAWDCATGNGQVASLLAKHFKRILATDISQNQLAKARSLENIFYSFAPAESTAFPDDSFDLITVAQAYHWFNFTAFEKEARRVGKPGSVVAIWGYNLMQCGEPAIDELVRYLYKDVVGPYWDAERKYVENDYRDAPFNFEPLPTADFAMKVEWSRNHVLGYMRSWSAVQNFIKAEGFDPVNETEEKLSILWEANELKQFQFPVFLKLGRIQK